MDIALQGGANEGLYFFGLRLAVFVCICLRLCAFVCVSVPSQAGLISAFLCVCGCLFAFVCGLQTVAFLLAPCAIQDGVGEGNSLFSSLFHFCCFL